MRIQWSTTNKTVAHSSWPESFVNEIGSDECVAVLFAADHCILAFLISFWRGYNSEHRTSHRILFSHPPWKPLSNNLRFHRLRRNGHAVLAPAVTLYHQFLPGSISQNEIRVFVMEKAQDTNQQRKQLHSTITFFNQ